MPEERLIRFGAELDAVKARALARMGDEDVRYVRRLNAFSRTMEVIGRALIFFSPEPVSFLAGLGRIERDFDATLERDEPDQWLLKLVPKQKQGGVGLLELGVRKSDASVAEARITDAAGTTTRIFFTDERRNVTLQPDLFHFSPPPGVDVVKPPTY